MGFSAHKRDKRLGPKKDGWNVLHFWVGYGSYFSHWILEQGDLGSRGNCYSESLASQWSSRVEEIRMAKAAEPQDHESSLGAWLTHEQ